MAPSLNKLSNHVTTLVDALGRLEHRLSLIGGDDTPRSTDQGTEDAEGAEGADDSEDYDEEDPDSDEDEMDVPAVAVKEELGSRPVGRTEGKLKPHEILQTIAGLQSVLERLDERTKILVEGVGTTKKKKKVIKVKVEGKEGEEWEEKRDGENAGIDSIDQNEDFDIQQLKGALITNQSSSGRPAAKRQKHQRRPSNMDPLLAISLVPPSPSPSSSSSLSLSSSPPPFPFPSPPSPLWTIAYTGVGLTIDARVQNLHDLRTFLSDFKKLSIKEDKQETNDNSSSPSLTSTKPHFILTDGSDIPDDTDLRLTKTERFGKDPIIHFDKDKHQDSVDTNAITNTILDLGNAPSEQITQYAIRYLLDAYFAKRCCHQHRTPFLEHNSFFHDHYGPATFSAMADPDFDPTATASLLLIYSMCAFGCKKSFLCHPPSTDLQPSPDEAFVERMEVHFYSLARLLLAEAFDTPSLPAIQSLIHLHFFDCFRRKHDVADKLIGIAVRMAFDLSLFNPEEPDESADSPRSIYQPYDSPASGSTGSSGSAPMTREHEERRLTAFKLLFLDFYSAFHVGRPAAIDDREWDRVPSQREQIEAYVSANEPHFDDPTRPAIVRLFVCMLELTRVQKRIMQQLPETQERVLKLKQAREEAQVASEGAITDDCDDKDDEDGDEEPDRLIARKVRSLNKALAEWYRRLPDYFIFDLANRDANPDDTFSLTLTGDSPISPSGLDPTNRMMTLCRLALHQAYHLNRILLYRQFIPDSTDEQTQSSDTFLNLCLDAARGIARLTELLVEHGSCFIHLQSVFFAGFVYSRIGKLYPGDAEAVDVATKGLYRCVGALKRSVPFRFGLDLCRDYVNKIEGYLEEVETAVREYAMAQEQA